MSIELSSSFIRKEELANLREFGVGNLDDEQSLSLILSYGTPSDVRKLAQKILAEFGSIDVVLRMNYARLMESGLSDRCVVAILLVGILMRARLLARIKKSQNLAHEFFLLTDYAKLKLGGEPQENLIIIFMDENYRYLNQDQITGTIDHAIVYTRELVIKACNINAKNIVIAHNHPSGIVNPSEEDIELTKKIKLAIKIHSINLVDHLIVTPAKAFSFRENNLL